MDTIKYIYNIIILDLATFKLDTVEIGNEYLNPKGIFIHPNSNKVYIPNHRFEQNDIIYRLRFSEKIDLEKIELTKGNFRNMSFSVGVI